MNCQIATVGSGVLGRSATNALCVEPTDAPPTSVGHAVQPPIAQRPTAVHRRQEIGHWESDTMVGTRGCYKPRLLVSVERVSRYTRLSLMPDALPWTVARQLQQDLLGSEKWPVHSLTVDRGCEFAHLPDVLERSRLFVCDPQRPNQRGTNENTIGLVRQ